MEIDDNEVNRLLRENPFHLDLIGRSSLNVLTPIGIQMVRIFRGGGEGRDVAWGFFRHQEPSGQPGGDVEEVAYTQFLPAELPSLGSGPLPYVGIDGRTAAVIQIRYP